MNKRFLWQKLGSTSLLLILTSVFVTTPVQVVGVSQTSKPSTKKPAVSATRLTLQDLPAGFQELPPDIILLLPFIFNSFKQYFPQQNIQSNNLFAFFNPKSSEIVLGSTEMLPNKPLSLLRFDASLQQSYQLKVRQKKLREIQQQLQATQTGDDIIEYEVLPDLNNVANASIGITLLFIGRDRPLFRADIVGFRRNKVGAFIGIGYLDGSKPVISLKDVAIKLDDRILQSSPTANTRSSNR